MANELAVLSQADDSSKSFDKFISSLRSEIETIQGLSDPWSDFLIPTDHR